MDRVLSDNLMRDLFWKLMTDQEYSMLEKLIEDTIGVNLNPHKRDFIENMLIKRFKVLGISDFETYYAFLKSNAQEMTSLINLMTNISTDFFRENHHFEYMASHMIPTLLASKQKIRLWSAGCSTGEEPYSMAMTLYDTIPNLDNLDVKILATDINTDALETARLGLYDLIHSKKISKHRENFDVILSNNVKKIKMHDNLKKIIAFKKLNLLEPWPIKNPFDIIFCRNVTIYLKPEVTTHLFLKFDKLLKVGGFLVLGHSENLSLFQGRYVCLGKTIYQKVS